MSKTPSDVSGAIGTLTEAVNNLKSDLKDQGEKTNEYRDYTHKNNSVRDEKITTLSVCLERLTTLVEGHDEIARSINTDHLDSLNDHHAYISKQIAKQQFWEAMRARLMEKGLTIFVVLLIASGLYLIGLEDIARKLIGG